MLSAVDDRADLDVPALDPNFAARYVVRGRLGSGGMGDVRMCTDKRIGRHVALKVLHRDHAGKPELRKRFLREARIRQLEHPAVVPVHDLGLDADGRLCFTMKQVRGQTLADILELQRGNVERNKSTRSESCSRRFARCVSRWISPIDARCCTAISSRTTSCWATSAKCTCSTGASRRSRAAKTQRPESASTFPQETTRVTPWTARW